MSDPLSVTPACVQFLLLHSLGCGASLLARAHCVSVRLFTAAMQPASSSVTHQTTGPGCPQCRLAPTVPIYACLLPAPPPSLTGQRGKAALSVGSHCVGLCPPAHLLLPSLSRWRIEAQGRTGSVSVRTLRLPAAQPLTGQYINRCSTLARAVTAGRDRSQRAALTAS